MFQELDEVEKKILIELSKNARISLKELSLRVGLPKSTLFRKIKKLEKDGVIRKYTICIDEKLLGNNVSAFILVKIKDVLRLEDFCKSLRDLREIKGVYRITGPYNVLLMVSCATIVELNALIKTLHKKGAVRTVTNIILEKFLEGIELKIF
ncbi:MAG: Lrp/AsnC family transcriptional regulator [Archaeoglobaceae archaeon]